MNGHNKIREKIYKNYFEAIYSSSNRFTQKEYETSSDNFECNFGKFLPFNKTAKILDIGCGTGHFLHFLMARGYTNYFGIDLSESQIEFCSQNITPCCATADAFEYLKNKKDVYSIISANDVLEHISRQNVIQFLELIYSALMPEAALLLMLPNMSNPLSLNNRYRDFTHECGFTEKSIYQVIFSAGFRKILIKPSQTPFSSIKNIMSRPITLILHFLIKKMFWYQGFEAPQILSSRLVVIAKK